MLNMKCVLIFGLALAFFIVGCGQDQGTQTSGPASKQVDSILDEGKKMARQAQQEASQLKDSLVKQASEIKDNTTAIVTDLITNAKNYLDKGRFTDAITSAQEVLTNYDADFQQAKDIITTATKKMKAVVAEKTKAAMDAAAAIKANEEIDKTTADAEKEAEILKSTTTEEIESLRSGLTDKLNSLEQ